MKLVVICGPILESSLNDYHLTRTVYVFYPRWFRQLNDHFGVRGEAYYLYKPKGKSRTVGLSGEEALHRLKKGLQNPQMAFIYHSYNHYFCPIGYEDSPSKAVDAYRSLSHSVQIILNNFKLPPLKTTVPLLDCWNSSSESNYFVWIFIGHSYMKMKWKPGY